VGLAVLLAWPSKYAVFVALPFVGVWNSIAGPATLRVVGDTLAEHRRSMAFSLQSIQKRLSSLLAYFVSGELVLWLGEAVGVRAAVALSMVLVAVSWLVQYHYMRTAVADQVLTTRRPLALLRRFDPQLRRLLISDICVRWCDGMPRELVILYCVPILAVLLRTSETQTPAEMSAIAVAFYIGVLLVVMNVTSLMLYLPVGHWASKGGAAKKPFIGLTFVFFALYPLVLVALAGSAGVWGLVLAFVVAGLREFGEPARKAMITELVPADCRTQAIGIYWSARSAGIVPASLAGGLVWYLAGPETMLCCAGAVGVLGAAFFHLRFARGSR
jgi:MFS family permease